MMFKRGNIAVIGGDKLNCFIGRETFGRMEADTLVAFSSAIIALSALGLSAYQAISLKKHNRLSVTPLVRFNYHRHDRIYKVHITNGGLGPAMLHKVQGIYKEHNKKKTKDLGRQFWETFLEEFETKRFHIRTYGVTEEDVMLVNEEKVLFRIEPTDLEKDLPPQLINKLNKLEFRVYYESLYRENFDEYSGTEELENI